jgi:hypothetical protein
MTDCELTCAPENESAPGNFGTAEFKRQAARRRFLKGGEVAGTGTIIVTVHHKRAAAASRTNLFSWVAARSHTPCGPAAQARDLAH